MQLYLVTNHINGKIYIGQTCKTIEERWWRHSHDVGGASHLSRAIIKYGAESFSIKSILQAATQDELDFCEIMLIGIYQPEYNIASGGTGGDTSHTTAWKKGMASRRSYTGAQNPAFGTTPRKGMTNSPEMRSNISKGTKIAWSDNTTRKQILSERMRNNNPSSNPDVRRKISETLKARNASKS